MAKTRVALLAPWHPEPVDTGGKQRLRNLIAALCPEYEVALIVLLAAGERARGALPPVPGVWGQWAFRLPDYRPTAPGALLAGLHPYPRSLVTTWNAGTARVIREVVRRSGAAVALGQTLHTLRYLLALDRGIPIVFDEPNVSPFLVPGRGAAFGVRGRAAGRALKYRLLLRRANGRVRAVTEASAAEAGAYRAFAPEMRVLLLENGIATLPREPWQANGKQQLLYSGALSYAPNADAVEYFVRAILPGVLAAYPDARLVVTGAVPSTIPAALRHPQVRFTGLLDREAFERVQRESAALVVPLLRGTGTRVKVLEALALGMPVISTGKGVEGLATVAGEHLLVADDPADFAEATIGLLRDQAGAAALGARGRDFVGIRYNWATEGERLRALVRELAAAAR